MPGAEVVIRDATGAEQYRTSLSKEATETGHMVMVPRDLTVPFTVELAHEGEVLKGRMRRDKMGFQLSVTLRPGEPGANSRDDAR